eukprot:CAMPEP_0197436470 /NCGR_PEP_ID=MMETSP1175-20131217/3912_1 /TAXON_ID=1003142 /ORGANISM="Triceratium dubium, Strain CCMP147" /LENGTH=189 /DNA_ID=CAMNT_0042965769 /DNA_START=199 /DNA_END=768 /DNA_ORIENTATION=-
MANILKSDRLKEDTHHFCQREDGVKERIKHNEKQLHDDDHGGWTDLHELCQGRRRTTDDTMDCEFFAKYVDAHQDEAREQDDEGQLPMDYLLRRDPPVNAVETLLEAYPEAVYFDEGVHGDYPVHVAVRHGASPEVVKLLIEKNPGQLKWRSRRALHKKGFTTLELAERLPADNPNKEGIVELLKEYFK